MRTAAIAVAMASLLASPCVPASAERATPQASAQALAASRDSQQATLRAGTGRAPILRFMTYNICKVTCAGGRFSWQRRRPAISRTVAAAAPDVLATQEMSYEQTASGAFQWQEVAEDLSTAGYRLSEPDGHQCDCVRGTHVMYRADRMELADLPDGGEAAGIESLADLTGSDWGPIESRGAAWAFVRHKASGRVTLVVSVHLPNEKTTLGERLRRSSAAALARWATAKTAAVGLGGAPIVVMGDLNSFSARQPRGAQRVFSTAGFRDGFTARTKVRADLATANYGEAATGWPRRPISAPGSPPRLDYVLVKGAGAPRRYEVFVRLTAGGDFQPEFRGSDHNAVLVDLTMPADVARSPRHRRVAPARAAR